MLKLWKENDAVLGQLETNCFSFASSLFVSIIPIVSSYSFVNGASAGKLITFMALSQLSIIL